VIPLSITRDHTGPMGRNVKDIAISMQYSDGPDPNDPRTIGVPPAGDYVRAATPVMKGRNVVLRWSTRLGVPPGWADGTTATALARQNVLAVFSRLGAEIVQVETPAAAVAYAAANSTAGESSEAFREELRGDLKKFNGRLTGMVSGLMRGADHYISGRRAQYLLSEALLEQLFDKCDAMISPPSFDPAGFPMLAFPIGFNSPNDIGVTAPIGMIIGGRPYDEVRLLSLVAAFQAVTDFHTQRPPEPTETASLATLRSSAPEIRVTPEELYELELAGVES
jgi:Asp-tRNA(Asn)/Glu-tRNA(Gln) amidotransferase A subunit family amidase